MGYTLPPGDKRSRPVPNKITDLGWCWLCKELVKKGSGWGLWAWEGASRLLCAKCKK